MILVFALSRVVPWRAAPGVADDADPKKDPLTVALRTAMIIGVGWLCTSMYTLSWYDLQVWMAMALISGGATRIAGDTGRLTTGKLDRLMIIRGSFLSSSFVPGRAVPFGASLSFVAARFRDVISPTAQILVLVAIFLWWRWPQATALWPLRRRQRPAVRPPAEDADPADRSAAASPTPTSRS